MTTLDQILAKNSMDEDKFLRFIDAAWDVVVCYDMLDETDTAVACVSEAACQLLDACGQLSELSRDAPAFHTTPGQ